MSDHDPLCVNRLPGWCQCDLIARVRADERERWGLGWIATANMVSAMTAAEEHAEAVAARLVEVICEQEAEVRERIAQEIEAMDSGWTQYQRMPENTTHICYVHENGEVYDPERGWLPKGESLLLDHADPLVSRDRAARIARGQS